MRARKVDRTQKTIVEALRRSGCRVWVVDGALDLVVQRNTSFGPVTVLLEVKAPGGRMTSTQTAMHDEGWHFFIVETVLEAYEAVGVPLRMRV